MTLTYKVIVTNIVLSVVTKCIFDMQKVRNKASRKAQPVHYVD